jgi:hypothetical protein
MSEYVHVMVRDITPIKIYSPHFEARWDLKS